MKKYLTSPNVWMESFLIILSLIMITLTKYGSLSTIYLYSSIIVCLYSSISKRYSLSAWSKFSRKYSRLCLWYGCVIVPLVLNFGVNDSEYIPAFTLIAIFSISNFTSIKHLILGLIFLFFSFGSCFTLFCNVSIPAVFICKALFCIFIFLACFVLSGNSFSFGEAFTVAQLTMHFFVKISSSQHDVSLNIFPFTFLVGSATGVFTLFSVAGLSMMEKLHYYRTFYFYFAFCVIALLVLAIKGFTIIMLILDFIFERSPVRLIFVAFWLLLMVICFFYVNQRFSDKKASTSERKLFHIFILIVYFSGLLFDIPLLFLCSTLVLCVFIIASLVCAYEIKPFGSILYPLMAVFTDKQDSGKFILTPIYLVFGLSFPVWFCFIENPELMGGFYQVIPFQCLSGILSVGIGDASASFFGSKYGIIKIPGTVKSIEGAIASIIIQMLFTVALLSMNIVSVNITYAMITISVVSFVEACTTEIDNLVLPLLMYALLL